MYVYYITTFSPDDDIFLITKSSVFNYFVQTTVYKYIYVHLFFSFL